MHKYATHVYFATLAFLFAAIFVFGDTAGTYFFPEYQPQLKVKKERNKRSSAALEQVLAKNPGLLVPKLSAIQAKSVGLFWMSDIEGQGAAIDLRGDVSLLESLFPGYGRALYHDDLFWDNYFRSEFGPTSFLKAKPDIAGQGFRVAYSWTGCFDIYKKHGADVLVIGSSEVYSTLIPEQLAENLGSPNTPSRKVLFCGTPGMSSETAKLTIRELLRIKNKRPDIVIFGYSFWSAYARSRKLKSYELEKNKELAEYISRTNTQDYEWQFFGSNKIFQSKASDLFPKIAWDDILEFSISKLRATRTNLVDRRSEGTYISQMVYSQSDEELSEYLRTNLKPFYDITLGITESDCSMVIPQNVLQEIVSELKQLSPNVFVYLAPTSLHHRKTVPECFLPSVKSMLKRIAIREKINVLVTDSEGFGLRDRDFVLPTLDPNVLYFDINHTNYAGGQKITKRISSWVSSLYRDSASIGGR